MFLYRICRWQGSWQFGRIRSQWSFGSYSDRPFRRHTWTESARLSVFECRWRWRRYAWQSSGTGSFNSLASFSSSSFITGDSTTAAEDRHVLSADIYQDVTGCHRSPATATRSKAVHTTGSSIPERWRQWRWNSRSSISPTQFPHFRWTYHLKKLVIFR